MLKLRDVEKFGLKMDRFMEEADTRIAEIDIKVENNRRDIYAVVSDTKHSVQKMQAFIDNDFKRLSSNSDSFEIQATKLSRDYKTIEFYIDKILPIKVYQ